MASVRIVLMLVNSIGERTDTSGIAIVALIRNPSYLLNGPAPPCNVWGVDAMLVCMPPASDLPVAKLLLGMHADGLKFGNAVDSVNRKAEAVGLVVDRQFHWRIDIALLFVPADMKPLVLPAIRQTMHQPRVTVEVENDGFVCGEEGIKITVRQSV